MTGHRSSAWTDVGGTRGGAAAMVLPACALLLACAPTIPQAKAPLAPAASDADDTASTTIDDSQAALYVYSPVGKRDPFRNPATLGTGNQNRGKGGVLQQYDLDQLRLEFTVTATSSPFAMVIDPSGQGHMVQIGDFIGKNWGKVSAIKREELTVMETIADPNTGRIYPDYISMKMPKTSGEMEAERAILQLQWSPEGENQ